MSTAVVSDACNQVTSIGHDAKKYLEDSIEEIKYECIPAQSLTAKETWDNWVAQARHLFHMPYSPAFWNPGWLIKLFVDPKDEKWFDKLSGDIFAGFTVGMTVIPQALSYAQLAGLPPINGLYAVIFPSIIYIFLGSAMQLSVGPVALVSLLFFQLVGQYHVKTGSEDAVILASEASLAVGLWLVAMGFFNLGNLIRFISYPVMSGFTTASAMIIGLNQIKNGFGFASAANVPQTGSGVEWNWQVMRWYQNNWYGRTKPSKHAPDGYLWRNVHATDITFGIYVPLLLLFLFKKWWKPSDEVKKTYAYKFFNFVTAIATLLSLIIAAHEAWIIRTTNDTYHAQQLKIVGDVPPGLNIFHRHNFIFPFGKLMIDVIPMAVVSYMEGYSVARKSAAIKGELSILNASQELWALGIGNMINSVTSGYPVSGSFSRSSLYVASGASTPLAKIITTLIVIVTLGTLTKALYWIPQAALAAVVMVAVVGLIDFYEFWVAWKLSKKDFLVMVVTFVFTLCYDTRVGLTTGVAVSIAVLLKDMAYSLEAKPISRALNFKGVQIIRMNSNLVFVSAQTIRETLVNEIFSQGKDLKAVVLDFIDVKHADMSGLISMQEVMNTAHKQDLRVFLVNVIPEIQSHLNRTGIEGDDLTKCSVELQDAVLGAQAIAGGSAVECLDVESLGMVTDLLKETKAGSLLELAQWSAKNEKTTPGRSRKGTGSSDGNNLGASIKNPSTVGANGELYEVVASNEHED